ncbi:hypothetical protein PanWU01x14_017050 [Parasponia andersonii]|uniref:DUF8039 domain-containing protein n=1 Tax=Parasponia andersonii TaxID=3476 RepID=A0A2P5DZY7_PARAD|nr:hypothetical protein PanWU01x14_017050 [Parasponia andersonii]
MVKVIIDMENEGADDVYQFTTSQSSQGHVQESTSSTIIHGRELGENNFRVSVEVVLNATALIPIPNLDVDTRLVGDTLGSHLAWPKMLVIFEDNLEFNDINRYQTEKNKSSQSQPPQTQERVHPQRNNVESVTQTQFKFVDGAPASIKLLLNTIQGVDESVVVNVPFDEEVHLHHLVTQYGYQARYMFMDPSAVATEDGPREDRAISLATWMLSIENEHQFLITPWNHE